MKKLLLIPTLATSVVTPIIATTSCGKPIEWIEWDFKENEQYDYKVDIPDKTVTPYVAFNHYLDMVEKNHNDFVHEYMLSISKQIQDIEDDPQKSINIRTWKEDIKIDSFDKKQKRVSFSVNVDRDYTTLDGGLGGETVTSIQALDIVCKNIPLTYSVWTGNPYYSIDTGTWGTTETEMQSYLGNDKKWSITGSLYVWEKITNGGHSHQVQFQDTDFTYNYRTTEPSQWEKYSGCCCFAFEFIGHPSYYMSNIPIPE